MRLRPLRSDTRRPAESRVPSREDLLAFVVYVVAAAIYVLIGVFVTDFLLSVFVAIAYLLVMAWLVPVAVRRVL